MIRSHKNDWIEIHFLEKNRTQKIIHGEMCELINRRIYKKQAFDFRLLSKNDKRNIYFLSASENMVHFN